MLVTNLSLFFFYSSWLTLTCLFGGFLNHLPFFDADVFAIGSSFTSSNALPISCNYFLPRCLRNASNVCDRI